MPTDGADFGRMRYCYGKAYTMARDDADNADVAECAMRGVERDIKRDGGAPAFPVAVDLLVLASAGGGSGQKLLASADAIRRDFADSPLTRHFAAAVETLGLSVIEDGLSLSRQKAEEMLLVQVAESRFCDCELTAYLARNRTKDLAAARAIVDSIKSKLSQTAAVRDLGARMRNGSAKGLPAKAAKVAPVTHSAESLNNEEI